MRTLHGLLVVLIAPSHLVTSREPVARLAFARLIESHPKFTGRSAGAQHYSSTMAPLRPHDSAVAAAAGKKAPKARVQRYLKSVEPQLRETGKSTLLCQGVRCSQNMMNLLRELRAMQAPNVKLLTKKNDIQPFADGQPSLEFLCTKNDCSLLAMASTNKKRPNNLIPGRTFDRQILDLCELGVQRFKSMKDYGGTVPKKRAGSKPCLLFVGDVWQQSGDYSRLQNMLTDFYRGDVVDSLVLSGIDHLIAFFAVTTTENGMEQTMVHQRTYFCKLKKNPNNTNSKTPVPLLLPCGPDMDFTLRRTQWAEPDLFKASRKQPRELRKKKTKNQSTNVFGETIGRLHLEKQNIDKMQGRKSKALRRAEKLEAEEEKAAIEKELEREKEHLSSEFQQSFGFEE